MCEYPEFSEVVGPFNVPEHCGEVKASRIHTTPKDANSARLDGSRKCFRAHRDACPAGYTTQASVIPDLFVDVPEHFRTAKEMFRIAACRRGLGLSRDFHTDLQFPTQIKSISYHSSEYFHMALETIKFISGSKG